MEAPQIVTQVYNEASHVVQRKDNSILDTEFQDCMSDEVENLAVPIDRNL